MLPSVGRAMFFRRCAMAFFVSGTGLVLSVGDMSASASASSSASAAPNVAQARLASAALLSASQSKTLTKAQFIARANALCSAAAAAMTRVFQQLPKSGGTPSSQEISAFIAAFAPVVQKQINGTKSLKLSKSNRAKISKMLQTDQAELNKVKSDPALLGGKQSPFLAADSLARSFGLEDAPGAGSCAK